MPTNGVSRSLGRAMSKTLQTKIMVLEAMPGVSIASTFPVYDRCILNECVLYTQNVIRCFSLTRKYHAQEVLEQMKRGVYDDGFSQYLQTVIMPLYGNTSPEKGKWEILKCDSGPGRMNIFSF